METYNIDTPIFHKLMDKFEDIVHEESNGDPVNFVRNPFLVAWEGYKSKLFFDFIMQWSAKRFTAKDIGSGKISAFIVKFFAQQDMNLVHWSKPDDLKHLMGKAPEQTDEFLYTVFTNHDAKRAFELASSIIHDYGFISTLFFLRDMNLFAPVRPRSFDRLFSYLGLDFKMSWRISWDNYSAYNNILQQARSLIAKRFETETRLIDAQTFMWIIIEKILKDNSTEE